MNEREVVHELERGPGGQQFLGVAAERLAGRHAEDRPDPLAPARDQVLSNIGDHLNVRGRLAGERLLDSGQVVAQQVEDLSCRRNGEGAHS